MSERELRDALERAQAERNRVEAERIAMADERDHLKQEKLQLEQELSQARAEQALSRSVISGRWPTAPFVVDGRTPAQSWSARLVAALSSIGLGSLFLVFYGSGRSSMFLLALPAVWGLKILGAALKKPTSAISYEFGSDELRVVRRHRGETSIIEQRDVARILYSEIIRVRVKRQRYDFGDLMLDLESGTTVTLRVRDGYLLLAEWLREHSRARPPQLPVLTEQESAGVRSGPAEAERG